MRWFRRVGVVSLLAFAFVVPACKGSAPVTDPTGGDASGGTGPVVSPLASRSAAPAGEIGGRPLEATKDGPWSVRRPKGMGAGAEGFRGRGAGGGAKDDSRAAAPGAAPPSPAPAMAEAESAAGGAAKSGAQPSMPASGPLRAGATDDNAQFPEFLTFLAQWTDKAEVQNRYDRLDVSERRFVRVVDRNDNPVPMASVTVRLAGKAEGWSGSTYGDGRAPFYPRVARERLGMSADGSPSYDVEVRYGSYSKRATWTGTQPELVVKLEQMPPIDAAVKLDVLFLIDTTGSMGDEINQIKATLLGVTERLRALKTDFNLQYGAVLYRDVTDQYLTSVHPFTSDIAAFDKALQAVQAGGGGDMPESVNQALSEAVKIEWRGDAAKVAFLIGDAPPHMDYQGDTPYGASLIGLVGKGVRVHSVAASGLDPAGTLVWRQVSQFTRGKFIFIEYGKPGESAKGHGVAGPVKSNNLDDIVFEQIRDELTGWGKAKPTAAPSGSQ